MGAPITMQRDTVFFPPMTKVKTTSEKPADASLAEPAPTRNVLDCLARAFSDSQLIHDTLRKAVFSDTRHGDLFVCLSAARRLEAALMKLIEAEEQS